MGIETGSTYEKPMRANEIFERLFMNGMVQAVEDISTYKKGLDMVAPIRAEVRVKEAPRGFPPDEIRVAWVGATLPIRARLDGDDEGYTIIAREAIETLREEKPIALEWWENYYEILASERDYGTGVIASGSLYRGWLANMDTLVFNWECGEAKLV